MTNEYLKHRQALKLGGKPVEVKVPKEIPKRSEKMQDAMAEYKPQMIAFLKKNPVCKADLSGCKKKAVAVHHQKGRTNELLHDQRYWLPVCVPCHAEIHVQDLMSKQKGLSISKHSKE
jgi:hypothetical protein